MSAMTVQMPQRRRRPHDTFALRLVALRHDLGMTQQQIADKVGVKRAAWNTWENGSIPHRQAEVARRIAQTTGYELDWLLFGGALSEQPTYDDHPTGRLMVRVHPQEQKTRRTQSVRTTAELPFRLIQTAA